MQLIKVSLFVLASIIFIGNISGCTMIKEMFLSDITKDLCEQNDWSEVGEYALNEGKNPDSFYEYQTQCKKYFSVSVANNLIDSFNFGYERARPSYCTTNKALMVGKNCGYYNIHACKGQVSEDVLLELFDAFQIGNEACISKAYSEGEFAGRDSAICL